MGRPAVAFSGFDEQRVIVPDEMLNGEIWVARTEEGSGNTPVSLYLCTDLLSPIRRRAQHNHLGRGFSIHCCGLSSAEPPSARSRAVSGRFYRQLNTQFML
jgi:hypothetical protein